MRLKRWRRVRGVAAAIGLAIASVAVPSAQQAGAPVRVTFRAVGDDGSPVTDLAPGDLTLRVNGKPRSVDSLTLVRNTVIEPAGGTGQLPEPYVSNGATRHGRTFYVLIDDDSITTGREGDLRDALHALLSELPTADRVGLLNTQGNVNLRPTDDRSKLTLTADALAGKSVLNESTADAQCRTTRVLTDLSTILALTGREPATIMVLSAGLTTPTEKTVQIGGSRRQAATGASSSDLCPVQPRDFSDLGDAAGQAPLTSTSSTSCKAWPIISPLRTMGSRAWRVSLEDTSYRSAAPPRP